MSKVQAGSLQSFDEARKVSAKRMVGFRDSVGLMLSDIFIAKKHRAKKKPSAVKKGMTVKAMPPEARVKATSAKRK
jgi:hypothetical protein